MTTDPSTDPLAPGPVFDPTADLPEGTTVLEASAGTGKTHAIAATTARLVALGRCRIDRVMLGTDYPFPLGEQEPGSGIAALKLDDTSAARIYHGTALQWLGLPAARFS